MKQDTTISSIIINLSNYILCSVVKDDVEFYKRKRWNEKEEENGVKGEKRRERKDKEEEEKQDDYEHGQYEGGRRTVSYTHLTLPTIYSV